jgi:flagellar basal-body rod modification protein FlgD
MTTTPVLPVTTGARAPAAAAAASREAGNYNAFLQLLVTQLRHQDPMKPMDPTQTVTQLATFASVEQAVQTNALLATLADNSALSQASALIGRTVTSADGTVSGVVKSIMVVEGGLIAKLGDGRELLLGPGVSIS